MRVNAQMGDPRGTVWVTKTSGQFRHTENEMRQPDRSTQPITFIADVSTQDLSRSNRLASWLRDAERYLAHRVARALHLQSPVASRWPQ